MPCCHRSGGVGYAQSGQLFCTTGGDVHERSRSGEHPIRWGKTGSCLMSQSATQSLDGLPSFGGPTVIDSATSALWPVPFLDLPLSMHRTGLISGQAVNSLLQVLHGVFSPK